MTALRRARLEEVAQVFGGGTPSRQEPSYFGGGIAWATPTDVTALNDLYLRSTRESVTEAGLRNSSTKLLPAGAVLLTSRATIGFTAVADVPVCTNQGFVSFVCGPELVPEFLAFWLRTQKAKMFQHAGGTTFKEIARGVIRKFEIAYPDVHEQRRIVDRLTRAEGIVRLRREAAAKAAELIPALFIHHFGDPATNPMGWPVAPLGSLAAVQGGLQVTRARSEHALERPYLRVANVYRDRLDLTEIKSIRLTEAELQRTRLQAGDLLFVEGHGNPAEVGRVAVWDDSIQDCTHQNHLIRARPDRARLLPEFACTLLNSLGGRQSLLRSGKTTSGLSTISTQNVKDAAVFLPPLAQQVAFVQQAEDIASIQRQQTTALTKAQASFDALLAQAFAPD